MRAGKVLTLVPAAKLKQQAETVAALEGLLEEAKAGRLIGLAAVMLWRPTSCTARIAGAAWEHPTYCRGMLDNLDDQLAAIIEITPVKR